MTIDEIFDYVAEMDGVLTLRPGPGDGSPEIAWGDLFFYYSPSGVVPTSTQPFATIVTKNYPGDEKSDLDRPDVFRVNIAASRDAFVAWTGHTPRETDPDADYAVTDTVLAHPVYAGAGWLAVVNPGQRTGETVRELLRAAYERARTRYHRNEPAGS
ncbi:hypothetical protein GV791_21420 [Nocardia cyriacigeorgica]|uniref:DUF6194 domain-containing protein n=2 Tax=Nocardia cyriacigeorgica TaxID=135487 RepID=H6R2S1_NOCCG|nr:DUF6194 family protein [Nocardia cyriacigeorgica]MBF6084772.1 hypothetical protein [Nocardia cyriacigeorgica]MBF6288735.1 hypothetical protein [Nocardia cyriacigeorgica]MBF6428250.1 hypothetical protein [Nocardia cyriacigeorgica]NEW35103.1 hypothetical protein [Nocardia cyriacigeorgica]CCF63115.1 conserved protein of unknown function [Nocardia cyriacigeorgica GUH-2]